MLKIILPLAVLSSCASIAPANAQEMHAAVQEPEYRNRFYAVKGGQLVSLEVVKPNSEGQAHRGLVSNTFTISITVPNAASSVRVSPSVHFVVKANTRDVDPATLFTIERLTPKKGERVIPVSEASAGMFRGVKSETKENATIPFTTTQYGQQSIEIVPSQPLAPGEYAIFQTGRQRIELDCFGIDGAK